MEPERHRQIERTKTGLLLLLVGMLLSWIPYVLLIGFLLILIGAILVILGRKAFGPVHSRNVMLATGLTVAGIVGFVALFVSFAAAIAGVTPGSSPQAIANRLANAFTNLLMGAIVVTAIASVGSVLFTYSLQQRIGKVLLWAGYGASVALSVATYAIVNPLLTEALNDAVSGGTFDPTSFSAVETQLTVLGLLGVIPSLLFAGAMYLARSRMIRGEIPPKRAQPRTPAGLGLWPPAPPTGPAPPINPS